MQFDWWTLALQTINFAVLVWLLHHFLYKPMLRMVDARRSEVDAQYAAAGDAEAKAKTELAQVSAERAKVEAERTKTLKAAASQAEEASAARHARAERDAAAIVADARKALAAERAEAVTEAHRLALDLGAEMARRLLDEFPSEVRAEAWLERIEQHLAGLARVDRDKIASGLDDDATLRVVTAIALPESAKKEWSTQLHRALDDHGKISFDTDASLIAGVELHFPTAILRFSWRGVMETMRSEMNSHDNAG
jgi:F-type H+-transporting ATPase subunit b